MSKKSIVVKGARVHSLKNIDVRIPHDRLTVVTGLSGSGKSSLAFDTIFAEGQRRYVESLSSYARQFLPLMEKPDVDSILGLSPAVSIDQKRSSHNPRSTVGTITEIFDYLRLLYARVGVPHCPDHGLPLSAQSVTQMTDSVLALPKGTRVLILAPLVRERKGEHQQLASKLLGMGFVRVIVNEVLYDLEDFPSLDKNKKHTIDAVVDRLIVDEEKRHRLADSLENALQLSEGMAKVQIVQGEQLLFSSTHSCVICGYSVGKIEPNFLSFNSPIGACNSCDGIGTKMDFDPEKVVPLPHLPTGYGAIEGWNIRNRYSGAILKALAQTYDFDLEAPFNEQNENVQQILLYGTGDERIRFSYLNFRGEKINLNRPFEGIIPNLQRRYKETSSSAMREEMSKLLLARPCRDCDGTRLKREARHVLIQKTPITHLSAMMVSECRHFFDSLSLGKQDQQIANKVIQEIQARLVFLCEVGLGYLSLDRTAGTLSGGEAQRIRLASQIGSGLVGVSYILDEPSIGLHQRDNDRLLATLRRLRDLGNTLIVVEHDADTIVQADHVIDMGPGAGRHGGEIVVSGTPQEVIEHAQSLTGRYLSGKQRITSGYPRRKFNANATLTIEKARGNNLKKLDITIPMGLFTCITGVSGSGKSTLIRDTLYPALCKRLGLRFDNIAAHDRLKVEGEIDKVIEINQQPIGRTSRSNPATYTGLFTPIRERFAELPEARIRGYTASRFSFNVRGGRCEACTGEGVLHIGMHFLPDVSVLCEVCEGKRFNRETLDIRYKGLSISDVLHTTVDDACDIFKNVRAVLQKLKTLQEVGLGYIQLGQSATTLSGGEAQRIKLAKELARVVTGNSIYLLDEPTTGLHFHDIQQLLTVLHRLCEQGNTVIVIEHNLDLIQTADWIIDLGPEGGPAGGELIACGTPSDIMACHASHTGRFLHKLHQQVPLFGG